MKAGVRVIHQRYGIGVVLAVAKDTIKVRFGQTERTLTYPGVFVNGILTRSVSTSEPPKAKGPEWAITGAAVSHKAFGDGVIETIDGTHMTVRFGKIVKPFLYPNAFADGHLIKGKAMVPPAGAQLQIPLLKNKRKDFVAYLRSKKYAETSANAMASAVSRVGKYVIEQEISKAPIFEVADDKTVFQIWTLLEHNEDFIKFDNSQNRRFSIAMKHYLDFLSSAIKEEPMKAERKKTENGRLSLVEMLRNAGFECIDNRATSSILWVLYDPAKKDTFERTIAGYDIQCKLEKRGALATNNAPAWRIMFN